MKFKKLFASVLAIALAVVAVPASPAKADTIEGSTAFLKTEVYSTVLPTTASQKFYLDPQGLADIANKNTPADLPTSEAGKIVGLSSMSAINASSRDVYLEVKYVVKVDTTKMDIVSSTGSIGTPTTKPAICLTVSAKNNSAYAPTAVSAGAADLNVGDTDTVVASSGAVAGGGTGIQKYKLQAAKYHVITTQAIDTSSKDAIYNSSNYKYDLVQTGASIELNIGGACASTADYSAFTGSNPAELNLEMTFKFTKMDGSAASSVVDLSSQAQKYTSGSIVVGYVPLPSGVSPSDIEDIKYSVDGTNYADVPANYLSLNSSGIGLFWNAMPSNARAQGWITFTAKGTNYKAQLW